MPEQPWELAQLNIGTTVAPLDSDQLKGFVDGLEPINALADAAPGFIWRLQDDSGDATSFRLLDDDNILVNMSVWTSIEALGEFVFRSEHVEFMRRRREWFEKLDVAITVLWWVPAGHRPSVEEAGQRLMALRADGPTAYAFTFREPFAAPGAMAEATNQNDDWLCPA
jgi:hypothetical protein